MRKTIKILLSWLCIFALATTALAHSGRTDSSGGHNDNRNKSGLGSYHYHCGGYPAHLHTCGYCPYRDVFPSRIKVKAEKTTTEYAWGDNGLAGTIIRDGTATTTVVPHYDSEGEAIGFTVKRVPSRLSSPSTTNTYTYVKNLQGDVLRILDSNGNAVVNYTYDPWGKPTVTGDEELAALNPCSYRGYDYDEETGYYYLQSRYYDPQIGRFLNTDSIEYLSATESLTANNLYLYCNNSPVNNCDPNGHLTLAVAGAAIYISAEIVKSLLVSISVLVFVITYRRQIVNAISKVLYQLQSLAREVTIAVKAALIRGRTSATAKHHIIARTDPRAWTSRNYWVEICGMGINDPINLVRINQYFHYYIHSDLYHAAVTSMVMTGWYAAKKAGVIAAVITINSFLRAVNNKFF